MWRMRIYAVRRANSRLIHKQVSFIEIYIKLCIISGMIDYIRKWLSVLLIIMGSGT